MNLQRCWQIWVGCLILWGYFVLNPGSIQAQTLTSIQQVNYQAGLISVLSDQQLAPEIQYLKETSPHKIVIDMPNAVFHPVHSEFQAQDQGIQKIRVSQFSQDPPAVRMVIDHTQNLNVSIRSNKTTQGFLTQIQTNGSQTTATAQVSPPVIKTPTSTIAALPDYQLTQIGLKGDNLYLEGTGPVVPQIRRSKTDRLAYTLTLYDYKSVIKGAQNIRSQHFEDLKVETTNKKVDIHFRLSQSDLEIVPYSTGNTCTIQFLPLVDSKNQAQLQNVEISEISPEVTRVRLYSTRDFDYQMYPLENPQRLVIDTQGTVMENFRGKQEADTGLIKQVRFIPVHPEKQADIRVVLDLTGEVRYQYQYDPKGYLEILLQADSRKPRFKKGRAFIVIDAGHGGNDPGAIGAKNNTREKDVTLAVSEYLKRYLENDRLNVVMTREEDLEILLQPRVDVANLRNADLFISIHANSMPPNNEHVNGIETYYTTEQSIPLAETLQRYLVKELGAKDRSIRKRGLFVTRKTKMPSVLLEIGFLSNPDEESKLSDANYQRRVARAIRDGIYDYLSKHPPKPKQGT